SSHSEGVPNVLLESHACGTPFIATAVGGVREIAIEGVDHVVTPRNVDALASVLATASPKLKSQELAKQVLTTEASARIICNLLNPELARLPSQSEVILFSAAATVAR